MYYSTEITPRRSRRVVKKISATLKKVVQEVVRGEGLNFLFTVRSEDIDIITFAIAFCSWAILDELKHLDPWIMIVSLRQCANKSSVHNRTTRNNEKFEIPLFRSATGQRTFAYRAVSLWNTLDEDLRNATTVKAFKKALKLVMNE